jgi:hypothetical protein
VTGQATREHALSEKDWQRRVMDCAKLHGWRCVHIRPARVGTRWVTPYEGDTGLPDLILARDGVVLLVELKAAKTPWKPGQREWLAAAGPCGFVWRPADWVTALAVLSAPRRATGRPEIEETP